MKNLIESYFLFNILDSMKFHLFIFKSCFSNSRFSELRILGIYGIDEFLSLFVLANSTSIFHIFSRLWDVEFHGYPDNRGIGA